MCGRRMFVGKFTVLVRGSLHDALRPRARPSRDGAQPDGDEGPRRDDEPRLSDDAPAKDASVPVPS
jgi:hypothetical protein